MIASKNFIFIHNFRSGGTYLNKFIEEHLGGTFIGYHHNIKDVPKEYLELPRFGAVRNPWDWYVSIYYHCLNFQPVMRTSSVVNHITNYSEEGLAPTITKLIDTSWMKPIDVFEALKHLPYLKDTNNNYLGDNITKEELSDYLSQYTNRGLYSWFVDRMFGNLEDPLTYIGQMESLSKDFEGFLHSIGRPLSSTQVRALHSYPRMNEMKDRNSYVGSVHTPRVADYTKYIYGDLADLISNMDRELITKFGYQY